MGKTKDAKKAHAALTEAKQRKKATKNLLKDLGEDSIDDILAELSTRDKAATAVSIEALLPPLPTCPSPRSNCSLVPHPSKPLLVLFGGEYYNGQTVSVYSDLLLYHIPSREWRRVTSPSPPAPRSAHQAVVVVRGEEQSMLVFGGEFQSPSASQFHHFSHLYSLSLDSFHWTLLGGGSNKGGGGQWPPGRSGHRMVAHQSRSLLLFGGFVDDGVTVRFLNDLWLYDLAGGGWRNVGAAKERRGEVDNDKKWPSPRGGFAMWVDEDSDTAYVYGGVVIHAKKKKAAKGAKGGGKGGEEEEEHLTDLWALHLPTMQWTPLKKRGRTTAEHRAAVTGLNDPPHWCLSSDPLLPALCRSVPQREERHSGCLCRSGQ